MYKFKDTTLGIKKPSAWRLGGASVRRAAMTLAAVMLTATTAWADTETISYIDANGQTQSVTATVLDGTESNLGSNDATTWYVVNSDISHSGKIDCRGNVNIILVDGKTMTTSNNGNYCIWGDNGSTLTIYGQSLGTGTLKVTSTSESGGICIYVDGVIINGGTVEVTGQYGIYVDNVTINGGTVTATGSVAGIYARHNVTNNVTINGGKVTATGPFGINANRGTITLGWTNADDFIKASDYGGAVTVTAGLAFLTDDNPAQQVSGTVNNTSLIDDKKLTPDLSSAFTDNGDDTYTINNAYGWKDFCNALDDGTSFNGKTIKLAQNISVTRMAGSSDHKFTGTFNGQGNTLTVSYSGSSYVAPFSYVDGATIQNLVVEGTISSSDTRAAGVIGETGSPGTTGKSYITNCVSSSTITGGNYSGGFSIGGNVEIEGCVFNGTINGNSLSGGFVGYSQSTLKITNSLFAPQSSSSISGGTFYYNNGDAGTLTNCYYTEALGTAQGKAPRTVEPGTNVTVSIEAVALTGSTTAYDVSGITAYSGGGLALDNGNGATTLYYGSGDQVSLTLASTTPEGYTLDSYNASAGTLSGSANPYTLTMPDEDVMVTANYLLAFYYGTCGTNVYYAYNSSTNTLTIFGTGEMADYDGSNMPWYSYRAKITTVIISDEVTSIGNYAFNGCTSLTSIVIPVKVSSIGKYAFNGCTDLTSVTIYPSLNEVSVGDGAFANNASGRRIYVYRDCVDTYKAQASTMGASADDILPLTLTVNGQDANYTTSKFFIDEVAGETISLKVEYLPEVSNPYAVEIYSNVGRRDFWNADIDNDGVADAIRPPSGDLVTADTEDSYFAAIPMEWDETAQAWKKWLTVGKTGAYRLTARYKATESDSWHYYSMGGQSDHVVVISPRKALEQIIYEVNGMTAKASEANEAGHSTFVDLIEGEDSYAEFGLPYLNNIGVNCLWLQPIHPSSEDGGAPGDPYKTADFLSVSKWYGKKGTTDGALSEFQSFVSACDAGKSPNMSTSKVGTINIMLDAAFGSYAGPTNDTEELWKSLGSYVPFWLENTGHNFGNERGATYDDYGIDGLRCDDAQDLPQEFWEYCINRARSKKWNFMFMAESRDGGQASTRNSRLFDIIDDSFASAVRNAANPSDLLAAISNKQASCDDGAVLLNLASHDEPMPYGNPWKTASRYAMLATVEGLPMTFYGQEQGIVPLEWGSDGFEEGAIVQTNAPWTGFTKLELSSGKWIPAYKSWNKMTVWGDSPMGAEASHGMAQLYGQINRARQASPALQSDVQWMLDRTEGYRSTDIWAMAKAEEYGALANGKDAVLAFVLFVNDTHYATSQTFSISGKAANLLGLEAGKSYTARNLASTDPEKVLWVSTTEELTSEGVWVNFNADNDGSTFYNDGAMVYFLKLEDAEATYQITYVNAVDGEDGVTNNNADTYSYATGLDLVDATKAGYTFGGWYSDESCTEEYRLTSIAAFVRGDKMLWAKWTENVLTLLNDDSSQDADHKNSKLISDAASASGKTFNVTLQDRTLYKDGKWNTLCLPFDVTVGSDVMAGATAMTLNGETSGFNSTTGELTLNFTNVADGSTITAGTPFIAKWTGSNVTDPVFTGVTVSSTTAGSVTSSDDYVTFIGTYNSTDIYADPATNLYLGANNKLYYPWGEGVTTFYIGSFRAYFHLGNGLTCGEPAKGKIRGFNLNFGDEEETTGIISTTDFTDYTNKTGAWYDMQGRKLSGQPTQKGLYIHNGKKIVIK